MKKKILSIQLVLLLAISLVVAGYPALAPGAEPREKVTIDISTCPLGTLCYSMGMSVAETLKKHHSWLRARVAETPGYIYNYEFLERNPDLWGTTMILGSSDCASFAAKKLPPFKTQVMGMKKVFVQLLCDYALATLDPKIKTTYDLKGKKVALGHKTQIAWGIIPYELIRAAGLEGKVDVNFVGPAPALRALTDGLVDAAMSISFCGTETFVAQPATVELFGTGKKIGYVNVPKEVFAKANKALGITINHETFPPGTFDAQVEEWTAHLDDNIFMVKETFPEEIVYEFTKTFLKHPESMGEHLASLKGWSPKIGTRGLTKLNAHPGAVRAFEEAGIKIPEK